jgi:site-specific DNA-adenine methylase
MGSKAKIAASIALNFPAAENFYDLFGGGFAMSHYMVEKKAHRYKHFHYNEIKSDVVELVKKAINGEFNYDVFKPEWISREMFFARKDTDAYVRCVWSFGNNQKTYLFGPDIEQYKKSMHQAVVFDQFDTLSEKTLGFKVWPSKFKTITQKRLYLRVKIENYRVTKIPEFLHTYLNSQQLERFQQLEQLQQLQQLEQLQQLQQLEQLSFSALDYRDVPIKDNSVVYCDPPYVGTTGYITEFNHKEFYEWAATRNFPVFISEYTLPDTRFKKIYSVDKRSMLSHDKSVGNKEENLYWNGK